MRHTDSRSPGPTGLTINPGRMYGTGYDDDAVEKAAVVDGSASVHDGSLWGPNAEQVWFIRLLNAAHAANLRLIAHALLAALLVVHRDAEKADVAARTAEQNALDALEEYAEAGRAVEDLREENRAEGLQAPSDRGNGKYIAGLIALMLGDLAFNAVAFQLFGLSDRLLFGFLPYTDELHIGTAASVLALLVLAHFAGIRFREVLHQLDRGRRADDPAVLPQPNWVSFGVGTAYVVFALVLLTGVSVVRDDYLSQLGVDGKTLSFAAIQLGVFAAALALSIAHAHPYAAEWKHALHIERKADQQMERSCEQHATLVARFNGLVDEADALVAQAAHHVRVSAHDAIRQAFLYMRRVQLSQPELTTEQLFPPDLPQPEQPDDEALRRELIGVTGLPTLARLDTASVAQRRVALRDELVSRRAAARKQSPELVIPVTAPPAETISTNGGTHS